MAMNNYLSILTLNVNGLNAPIKRCRIAEWIENMTHTYAAYKRPTSEQKTYTCLLYTSDAADDNSRV